MRNQLKRWLWLILLCGVIYMLGSMRYQKLINERAAQATREQEAGGTDDPMKGWRNE
jgi:hypothetical protein